MQCQNCDAPILPSDDLCPRCGARPLHRRVIFAAKPEEFALTPEDELVESRENWEFPEEQPGEANAGPEPAGAAAPAVRWSGFFRRAVAFSVDIVALAALSAALLILCYIGYKVGLAAHDRAVTVANSNALFFFVVFGCIALSTGYFVLLHGMDGRTIGKWLLGLRVVGAGQAQISYRQAFLRFLGMIVFAPFILGHLWIIWSREKRAWHDFLAQTWVIRD